jgi:hypothetical protein
MDLSGADLAPRGGGVETLYSEGAEPPASFTPDVAPPPAPSQIVQPIKRESTLEAQKNKMLSHIQDKFDNGGSKVFYNSVPTYRTLFGLLQDDVDRIRKGLPPQATGLKCSWFFVQRFSIPRLLSGKVKFSGIRLCRASRTSTATQSTYSSRTTPRVIRDSPDAPGSRRMYRDLRDWHISTQNAARQELINQGIDPGKLVVREEMTMPGVPGTVPRSPDPGRCHDGVYEWQTCRLHAEWCALQPRRHPVQGEK